MTVHDARIVTLAAVLVVGITTLAQLAACNGTQQALDELRALAEQGDADAQNNLEIMYANGRGVPQDDVEAVLWYRRAADQGDASAQSGLGVMYEYGRGVPQDYMEAVRLYRLAADP